jgi:hypothetical protein
MATIVLGKSKKSVAPIGEVSETLSQAQENPGAALSQA